VVVDVVGNDSDPENDLDPTTVKLLDPADGSEVTTLTVTGEGVWSVDPITGEVTFTPEAGFTDDPTSVEYVVSDTTGLQADPATITVDYPQTVPDAVDDNQTGVSGAAVLVDVLDNDTDPENDIDPTTVKLLDPADGSEVTTLTVTGEGEWVVDPITGEVAFTPEIGFTDDPTPVEYVVSDTTGLQADPATITVDYPQTAPVAVDDEKLDQVLGDAITVAVVSNDTDVEGDLDPTTVIITASPAGGTIAADGKSVVVAGEGEWSVDTATGDITFTPEAGFTDNPTPISYTIEDTTGLLSNEATVTIDYDQLTRIEVEPPGRVSEEGLEGGNPDSDPDSTLDTTDSVTDTDGNWIRVTDTDTDLSNAVVNFVLPATDNGLTSQGNPVVFRIDSSTGDIVGEYEYTDSLGASQTQNVLTIALNGNKEAITDGYQFGYNVTLGAPVDHTQGDDIEGILSVDFGIEVYEDSSATNPLATSDELLAIIEDDSPAPQPVVWNIDVQQETVTITDLQTGFTDSLFTDPTRPVTVDEPSYLVAGSFNTAAGSSGDTIPLRDYGGTVGVLTAEQDATYQAADGNLYVDALDEAIYWGRPANGTSPAGYTTYENIDYQGAGEEIKFESNIDLGDFSHINFGVFGDGGTLLETELDLNFNVDVNGNSESVAVEYDMQHNETPNNATAATYGLDPANYDDDYVQSDFIVIPDATQIIDIAGQQYQLDLTFVNQDPLVIIDSDRNKTFLKAYQNNNGTDDNGDGLIDQSNYSTLGKLINGFANTNSAAGVSYYDLNGNGTIGDVGDAQYVGNTTGGYRYTVIGNSNFAYMDLDRNLVSDGIDFDGDNIIDTVLDAAGNLDYVVFSTNGRRAEDTNGDGIIDKYDSDGDNIVDTDFALDDYNPALDDENTFVVNSLEGQENTYDLIGKLTPLNLLPVLDNNVVIEGKVAVGGDAVDYLTTSSTGIIWSGVSTTDSDTTIEVIDTDGDTTNYEFRTDYGVFVGYADGSYKFNTAENIANIVTAGVDDIDVFSFEYQDSDGDTASSTVTLNYNEYATPQSPDSIDDIPSRTTADNDYLVGTNQAETLEGGAGDDTLVGLSGADILSGSDGNDILIFDRNDVSIDGGENSDGSLDNDTLLINDTNIIASTDMSQVVNFETINLTNDTAQTLSISLSDVVDITDGNNQLFIKGDSVDTVNVSDMTKAATSDQAGYDLYQDSGNTASLYIQTAIDDNII
ncbi:Ig-like domain-containing protein, partial [Psychrobacter proteolyticus]|uniref:Ig-like domain-containing protein n=1 Tax=Psychrobacter proteolyticus TaxID=147825 RepID=UPI00311D3272